MLSPVVRSPKRRSWLSVDMFYSGSMCTLTWRGWTTFHFINTPLLFLFAHVLKHSLLQRPLFSVWTLKGNGYKWKSNKRRDARASKWMNLKVTSVLNMIAWLFSDLNFASCTLFLSTLQKHFCYFSCLPQLYVIL